jgi:iron complex transport system substrate-binding protein
MTEPLGEHSGTTRRQFVVGSLGALTSVPLLLAACGGEDEAAPAAETEAAPAATGATTEAAEPAGPWTYRDGRGVEISLPEPPQRIVMQEYAAAHLIPFGIKPVGIFGSVPLGELPSHEGLDLSGVESVGEVWGEVNLEALVALEPDLIVTGYSPSTRSEASDLSFADDQMQARVEAIAPMAGILSFDSVAAVIERYEEFAALLGADVEVQTEGRERYEASIDVLKAAVEENPGVSVTAVTAWPDNLYVAKSADFPDLTDFVAWGIEFVDATGPDSYFDTVSWERADKYPSDLILYDVRATTPPIEEIAETQPTWRALPAVQAGQISPWHTEAHTTYDRYADQIEELAAAISNADASVVS